MEVVKLNRIKAVLAETDKQGKWLAQHHNGLKVVYQYHTGWFENADECSLAEQMFCSDDVRTPYESAPDDGDFDALRPVLITDSTSEIADDTEKR